MSDCVELAVRPLIGAILVSVLAFIDPAAAGAGKKFKKTYTNALLVPAAKSREALDKIQLKRATPKLAASVRKSVIFGQAAWVCTPSGFGKRATCAARKSFG